MIVDASPHKAESVTLFKSTLFTTVAFRLWLMCFAFRGGMGNNAFPRDWLRFHRQTQCVVSVLSHSVWAERNPSEPLC